MSERMRRIVCWEMGAALLIMILSAMDDKAPGFSRVLGACLIPFVLFIGALYIWSDSGEPTDG